MYEVTVTGGGGFNGDVQLSVPNPPSQATATFNPNQTQSNSTLSISTSARMPKGTYILTIRGTSGALTRQTTVTLVVTR